MAGRIVFVLSALLFSLLQNVEFVQCRRSRPEHDKGDTSRVILSLDVSKVFTTNPDCAEKNNKQHYVQCDYVVRICLAVGKMQKSDKCVYPIYKNGYGYGYVWEGKIAGDKRKWVKAHAHFEQKFDDSHRMTELTHPEKQLPTVFTIKDADYKPDRIYSLKVVLYKVILSGENDTKVEDKRFEAAQLFKLIHYDEIQPNGKPMKFVVQHVERSADRNPTVRFIFGANVDVWLECMHGHYGCSCDIQCLADDKYSCRSDGSRHCHKNYYPEGICGRHCITNPEDSYSCSTDGLHECHEGYLTKWNYEEEIECEKKMCLPDSDGEMMKCKEDNDKNNNYCCETPWTKNSTTKAFYTCVKSDTTCWELVHKHNNAKQKKI